jgi:succinate dehydrogenase/fumarate reductase flavoprotein subunit
MLGMLKLGLALSLSLGALSTDFQGLQLQLINKISAVNSRDSLETELRAMLEKLQALPKQPGGEIAVIGGGLSGLTATLRLLEQGEKVILIDKSPFFGGNSAKASSGINGALTELQKGQSIEDSPDHFYNDTMQSAQRPPDSYTSSLARRMADDSKNAVEWIADRANVDLEDVGQMGGHTIARTHRPRGRLSGAAFISGLENAIMRHKNFKNAKIHKGVALEGMEQVGSGDLWELKLRRAKGGEEFAIKVQSVVLATGGFGADSGTGGLLQVMYRTVP